MTLPDTLRYTRLPLTQGSGAIPAVGFGTLIPDPLATKQAVKTALEVGFRLIDCAERYRNEEAVGDAMLEAFKAGTVRREAVFVTTKLWNNNHRPEWVKPAFEASRRRLQLDYLDCYLIHTPFAFQPGDEPDPRDERGQVIYDSGVTLVETWRALERLVDDGQCKFIGLSDITLEKLREIVAAARIKPAVVQVESHPYLPEWDLLDFCRKHGIVLQACAALGHGLEPKVMDDPVITTIAQRIHKTPAQVALAWAVQRGTAFLTTSTTPCHIQENFEVSALPKDAMREIREGITTSVRFNAVAETGVGGFVSRTLLRKRFGGNAASAEPAAAIPPSTSSDDLVVERLRTNFGLTYSRYLLWEFIGDNLDFSSCDWSDIDECGEILRNLRKLCPFDQICINAAAGNSPTVPTFSMILNTHPPCRIVTNLRDEELELELVTEIVKHTNGQIGHVETKGSGFIIVDFREALLC